MAIYWGIEETAGLAIGTPIAYEGCMNMPRRIVRKCAEGWYIQQDGQKFFLDTRAVDSKRGWVWISEASGSRGSVPDLLLWDGPNSQAHIVGRAEPVVRWLSAERGR
jgi:hypothetical protein